MTATDAKAGRWTAGDIPDLTGKLAIVTGANSGLGKATARELARAGAEVIVASRDAAKGDAAATDIVSVVPGARLEVVALDLADLASVRAFARRFGDQHQGLDLLVNNAGVMAPPRRLTADGFESQFATNHLGHFALTGLLIRQLLNRPAPRVITVSSTAHRAGRIDFDNLGGEHGYNNWLFYSQSKLANLLFAFELDRRARAAGTSLVSVAAHPGYSATNLQFAGPSRIYERVGGAILNVLVAQSADMGALPTLYAATAPGVEGGAYIGPDGLMEFRGHPKEVRARKAAYNVDVARRLWKVSEEMTGVRFSVP